MSFREYIKTAHKGANPRGDFIGDARLDPRTPDAKSWKELKSYLDGRGASSNAIAAGKLVWNDYLAKKRRDSPSAQI